MTSNRPVLLAILGAVLVSGSSTPAQTDTPPPEAPRSHPITHEKLGIEFAVASSKLRRSIIRTKTPYGFAVRAVTKGSLAEAAGIRKGTIVLEIDGRPFEEVGEIEAVLEKAAPGRKIVLLCADRKKKRRLLDRKPWVQREVELELPAAGDGGDGKDGKGGRKPGKGEKKRGRSYEV